MESPTDTAYMSMLKVQSTKALGSTICMMEKVQRPGTKAISNTRAISKQARRLAKENLSLMEIIMRGISQTGNSVGMVHITLQTQAKNTLANSLKTI